MKYLEWNDRIASHFFNEAKAGQRVWLSIEEDLIKEIAQKNNTTFEDFIEAVKKGPDEIKNDLKQNNVCKKAFKIYEKWKEDKSQFEYPPYIAYLALFVLAVNHKNNSEGEEFLERTYYPRLEALIGENLSTQDFKKISVLWDALQDWTLENKKETWGVFHNDISGNRFYIGMPLYQVTLTKNDLEYLPKVFQKAGWDSDSFPTEIEILQILKKYGNNKLSNRTQKRIDKGKPDFCLALSNRVLGELRDYDEDEREQTSDGHYQKRGQILICLNDIDPISKNVTVSFRCKRANGLPDEEFLLKNINKEWQVPCPLSTISGSIKEFSIEDWTRDFSTSLVDNSQYQFHYKGEKYKIFTKGSKLEVDGWVSAQRHRPDECFYLAVHTSLFEKVQKWGNKECNEFKYLQDFTGVPKDWHLFKIKGVKNDCLIKNDISALAIDENPKIHFEGGIRISKGNQFFDFAPPKISIIGGRNTNSKLFYKINSEEKRCEPIDDRKTTFQLSKETPCGEWIKITLKKDTEEDQAKSKFMLFKPQLKKFDEYSNGYAVDHFGNLKEENENNQLLQGAYGPNLKSTKTYLRFPNIRFSTSGKIYWIGNIPGQIIQWPYESEPLWTALWAIRFKTHKKAIAYYLGNSEQSLINNTKDKFSKEKIQNWKRTIWYKRRRIKLHPQSKKSEKQKWKNFLEGIKHA